MAIFSVLLSLNEHVSQALLVSRDLLPVGVLSYVVPPSQDTAELNDSQTANDFDVTMFENEHTFCLLHHVFICTTFAQLA
jgi:hypothetical protein